MLGLKAYDIIAGLTNSYSIKSLAVFVLFYFILFPSFWDICLATELRLAYNSLYRPDWPCTGKSATSTSSYWDNNSVLFCLSETWFHVSQVSSTKNKHRILLTFTSQVLRITSMCHHTQLESNFNCKCIIQTSAND